jgi:monovalent cation:H+ antiporter-2, CPA2 family
MHGGADLILTITSGLAAALVLGYVTQRLGLSPIVGYLLGGVLVGPHTPGFAANREVASELAEIGVILLMFGVGLQFHFKELLAVRRVAVPGAIGQSLFATVFGCLVAHSFGWSWQAGIVFGLAISVASTVVLLRVLSDNNDLHTPAGHIAVGWLVVEDLFTVFVLVVLPALFPGAEQAQEGGLLWAFLWSLVKVSVLVAAVFVLGSRVIPWLLTQVAVTRSRELFTLSVLVLALGIAVAAAKVFGVSMALGAFLAGMVVGQSDFSSRAASEALPMRDAFAVLFFVSVGMLLDPGYFLVAPGLIAATLAVILLVKPLAAFVIVIALRYPLRVALAVAVALAQIGEFSFILASLGTDLGVLPDTAMNTLVGAAIVSISLNPLLYRTVELFERTARRSPRLWKVLNAPAATLMQSQRRGEEATGRHAIVIGYGPVGRTLVRMLLENDIEPIVIELNLETIHRLTAEGIRAVYGDATHRETLEAADARRAAGLILSSSGMHASDLTIRLARDMNPRIRILARASYLKEVPQLRKAGADAIFSGEGEVALTMTEFLLRQLGATPEQIDRERDRIRTELFGSPATMELLLPPPGRIAPPAAETPPPPTLPAS